MPSEIVVVDLVVLALVGEAHGSGAPVPWELMDHQLLWPHQAEEPRRGLGGLRRRQAAAGWRCACVRPGVQGCRYCGKWKVVLEVQVLRGGGLPEPEDLGTKGDTADEPITIMD
uniref:Uncharacterized protein n=1 Tax=Aegilops tauschii TaxID=37682 RepID=N1QTW7_AEGTA